VARGDDRDNIGGESNGRGPLVAIGVVALLFAVGWFLARELAASSKLEDCLMSGRTDQHASMMVTPQSGLFSNCQNCFRIESIAAVMRSSFASCESMDSAMRVSRRRRGDAIDCRQDDEGCGEGRRGESSMTAEAACLVFSTRGRATESLRRSRSFASSPESAGLEASLERSKLEPPSLGRPNCPRCGSILLMAEESRFNIRGRIDHAWSCDACGNAFVTSIRLLSR
jgi:ribosomal protein S27AE